MQVYLAEFRSSLGRRDNKIFDYLPDEIQAKALLSKWVDKSSTLKLEFEYFRFCDRIYARFGQDAAYLNVELSRIESCGL